MPTPTPTDFSAPIYAQPEEETEVAVDPSATAAAEIDYNDPALLSQEVEGDPTVDAYAVPPPPPDGWYRVKLKAIEVKRKDNTKALFDVRPDMDYSTSPYTQKVDPKTGKGKNFITIALEARIQDPGGKYDNVPVFDRFMDSRANRQGGVPMLTLLSALKVKIPSPLSGGTLKDTVLKALAGEPECDVEITWEGNAQQADSESVKAKGLKMPKVQGMHNFPQMDGKRQTSVTKEVAGYGPVTLRAQAKVMGYQPAGSKSKKK